MTIDLQDFPAKDPSHVASCIAYRISSSSTANNSTRQRTVSFSGNAQKDRTGATG